jgi:hypothetical protein
LGGRREASTLLAVPNDTDRQGTDMTLTDRIPTDRTTTFRRRFGAISLMAAPVLFSASELLSPQSEGGAAEQLQTYAAHRAQLLTSLICYVLSAILFLPALFSVMNPVRRRGTVLVHLGGGLALLGNALAHLVLGGVQFILYDASGPGVDRAAVVPFLDHAEQDPIALPFVMGHYLFVLGLILLGIGLYRAGIGYRWAAAALTLGTVLEAVVGTVGIETMVTSVICDGLVVAGFIGMAWWQTTTSNAAWDGRTAITSAEEPAAAVAA